MTDIKCIASKHNDILTDIKDWSFENIQYIHAYHQSFKEYRETPLAVLHDLSNFLGIKNIYIKDESWRFGLNAFKVLGASYAIGKFICEKTGLNPEKMDFQQLCHKSIREKTGNLTFITATDGNHGRGVAWTAHQFGHQCIVYMPQGSVKERLDNIRSLGAKAYITDLSYDDAVRKAAYDAQKNHWILIQDTSWGDYCKIPHDIMLGYTTMALETVQQINQKRLSRPTHIFLQAGVGAMSAALTAFFANYYKDTTDRPRIIIVEADTAECLYNTMRANDGTLHHIHGKMKTMMAGLACGEPCTIAWGILKDYADYFTVIRDEIAADGMRVLANPIGNDPRIISGESGAAAFGLVFRLLSSPQYKHIREQLHLDENSSILCFSTEGATDLSNYRNIIWHGANRAIERN